MPYIRQTKTQTNSPVDIQEEDIGPHGWYNWTFFFLEENTTYTTSTTRKRKILNTDHFRMHNHPHTWGACHSNRCGKYNQKWFQQSKKDNDSKNPAANQARTLQFNRQLLGKKALSSKKHKDNYEKTPTHGSVLNENVDSDNNSASTVNSSYRIQK